jgi:hypothetical protein
MAADERSARIADVNMHLLWHAEARADSLDEVQGDGADILRHFAFDRSHVALF